MFSASKTGCFDVCECEWAISAFFTYMKGVSNELALRHVPQVGAAITFNKVLYFGMDP